MDKVMDSGKGGTLVVQRTDGADELAVWVERVDAASRIVVGTRGQSTYDAFGTGWRMSCVAFDDDVEGKVIGALAGDAAEQSLEQACASYFEGGRQLSDLLDLLDAHKVAYVYARADECGVTWRPEPGECELVALANA